jgi:hypothetical protein
VKAFAAAGQLGRAEELARAITDDANRADMLGHVAVNAATHDDRDRAAALLSELEEVARNLSYPAAQSQALGRAAAAAAEAGALERALALADTISDPGAQGWALSKAAEAAAKSGDRGRAERIAMGIAEPWYRAGALSSIAIAAATARDLDSAERIAAAIRNIEVPRGTFSAMSNPHEDADQAEPVDAELRFRDEWAQTLLAVGEIAAASGELDRAERIAETVAHSDLRLRALGVIAETAPDARALDRAEEGASTSYAQNIGVRAFATTEEAYDRIAKAAARAGHAERAQRIAIAKWGYTESQAAHWGPTEAQVAAITNGEAQAAAAAGQLDAAERIAATIPVTDDQNEALAEIAKAAAQRDEPARAQKIAEQISKQGAPAQSFIAVAARLADCNHLQEARRVLARAWISGTWSDPLDVLAMADPEAAGEIYNHLFLHHARK